MNIFLIIIISFEDVLYPYKNSWFISLENEIKIIILTFGQFDHLIIINELINMSNLASGFFY